MPIIMARHSSFSASGLTVCSRGSCIAKPRCASSGPPRSQCSLYRAARLKFHGARSSRSTSHPPARMKVLGRRGTLYFGHATPRIVIPQGDSRPWGEPRVADVLGRLEAMARRLDIPSDVKVEFVSLHGEPAAELVTFAEQQHADMIATGAHGRSAIGRLVLGSVSTNVVRSAPCAVLVAPARPAAPGAVDVYEPPAQPIG